MRKSNVIEKNFNYVLEFNGTMRIGLMGDTAYSVRWVAYIDFMQWFEKMAREMHAKKQLKGVDIDGLLAFADSLFKERYFTYEVKTISIVKIFPATDFKEIYRDAKKFFKREVFIAIIHTAYAYEEQIEKETYPW